MSRLRPKLVFSGFTKAESEKMEKLLDDSVQPLNTKFFKNLARGFNQSSGRAGKPVVKWTEVESWFRKRQQGITPPLCSETGASKDGSMLPGPSPANESNGTSKKDTGNMQDRSTIQFEAKSSKDGAWYDVELFLCNRKLPSGDLERKDYAMYYDAHVTEIQRKLHDIRGCRCIFKIRYNHDNVEVRISIVVLPRKEFVLEDSVIAQHLDARIKRSYGERSQTSLKCIVVIYAIQQNTCEK
ncbi:unnamed protein product [Linum tenue]|uniref:SAWADEE domain-containing protein n=1 Tax=Linum tenue TaxID=586396 RepID=A0AAV0JKE4_9ROSI|nr:unnamed protein product [Linum tenue]